MPEDKSSSPQPLAEYDFHGTPVRVEIIDGDPWFVARDVGDCLKMSKQGVSDAVSRLDSKHKRLGPIGADSGQARQMMLISEPGRYLFVMRSRMPAAEAFQVWIAEKVLVELRKTGRFEIAPKSKAEKIAEVVDILRADVAEERAGRLRAEAQIEEDRPRVEWALDMETNQRVVDTRGALIATGLDVKLTRELWVALESPSGFFVAAADDQPRRWRAECLRRGFGVDAMVRCRGEARMVLVPRWTAKGVRYLREWLLDRARQLKLPKGNGTGLVKR